MQLRLTVYSETFAICRLSPDTEVGCDWHPFGSVTRTPTELSVICPDGSAPANADVDSGWRCLRIEDLHGLDTPGVLLAALAPLASAGLSVFAIASYETDHLLVREQRLAGALQLLQDAGHAIDGL